MANQLACGSREYRVEPARTRARRRETARNVRARPHVLTRSEVGRADSRFSIPPWRSRLFPPRGAQKKKHEQARIHRGVRRRVDAAREQLGVGGSGIVTALYIRRLPYELSLPLCFRVIFFSSLSPFSSSRAFLARYALQLCSIF